MARTFSKTTVLGYVGKDPEIRSTAAGALVANFSVATTERYKDQQGKQVEKTEWHSFVAFKRTAEVVRDYLKKGQLVLIEGSNQTRSWDDKESGKKMYRTEIVVHSINFLDGKKDGKASSEPDFADVEITDDDIPF
jgi:single-strand DNA-binding protein